MTLEEFNRGLDRLQEAFDTVLKQKTAQAYYEQVKAWPSQAWTFAVTDCIRHLERFPRIVHLRQALAEARYGGPPKSPQPIQFDAEGYLIETFACNACRDTGILHWQELAPPGPPFAGPRYWPAGRCRRVSSPIIILN